MALITDENLLIVHFMLVDNGGLTALSTGHTRKIQTGLATVCNAHTAEGFGRALLDQIEELTDYRTELVAAIWERKSPALSYYSPSVSPQLEELMAHMEARNGSLEPLTQTPLTMLFAHRKSASGFWNELAQKPQYLRKEFVDLALQWLGVYEGQLPGVSHVEARQVLADWFSTWEAELWQATLKGQEPYHRHALN